MVSPRAAQPPSSKGAASGGQQQQSQQMQQMQQRRVQRTKSRRRFSTACLQCRTQKIRCVRLNATGRCVNCNMGDKACTLMANDRSWPSISSENTTTTAAAVYDNDSANAWAETISKMQIEEFANQSLNTPFGFSGVSGVPGGSPPQLVSSPSQSSSCPSTAPSQAELTNLLPNVASMESKTVQYLNHQSCFTIPDQVALDQFYHQYFVHIHPLFPIIDEVHFFEMHRSKSTLALIIDGRFSLLVLYGMLYTSASYVPTSLIAGLGFHDIHQAKAVFHMRAKLLYDSRFEPSSIALAQAALLLSHCYYTEPPSSFKSLAPTWLGEAIKHAREAGADRYNTLPLAARPATVENEELRRSLKRVWWCCMIRDRVMPLAARKNIRVTRDDFDFEAHPPLDISDFAEEIHYSTIYDKSTKRTVVELLTKLLELCVVLTDVLVPNHWSIEDVDYTPIQEAEQASRIRTCRAALKEWHDGFLHLQLQKRTKNQSQGGSIEASEELIILFTNIVVMYYHSADLTLSHQEMTIFGVGSAYLVDPSQPENSVDRNRVTMATSQLVQCLTNLVRLRLAHCLPLSIVGLSMLPVALQILDLKLLQTAGHSSHLNPEAAILKQRQSRFVSLIEAIQLSRPRFNGVDWILHCIRVSVDAFHHLLFTNAFPSNSNAQIVLSSSKSWTDILRKHPKFYLSLATSMEYSLSNGTLPEMYDLPARFRTMERPKLLPTATLEHDIFPESLSPYDIHILTNVEHYSTSLSPDQGATRTDTQVDPDEANFLVF